MTKKSGPVAKIVLVSNESKKKLCQPTTIIISDKEGKDKDGKEKCPSQLPVPRLSVCADAQKVDRAKLAQTEFSIIEFDSDTFRILLDYLHTGITKILLLWCG